MTTFKRENTLTFSDGLRRPRVVIESTWLLPYACNSSDPIQTKWAPCQNECPSNQAMNVQEFGFWAVTVVLQAGLGESSSAPHSDNLACLNGSVSFHFRNTGICTFLHGFCDNMCCVGGSVGIHFGTLLSVCV